MADQLDELLELKEGWDTYGAKPISRLAVTTARALQYVPTSSGGVQVELHAGAADVEIEIDPDGTISSVYWAKLR